MKNKRTNISKFYCETLSSTVLYKVFLVNTNEKVFSYTTYRGAFFSSAKHVFSFCKCNE